MLLVPLAALSYRIIEIRFGFCHMAAKTVHAMLNFLALVLGLLGVTSMWKAYESKVTFSNDPLLAWYRCSHCTHTHTHKCSRCFCFLSIMQRCVLVHTVSQGLWNRHRTECAVHFHFRTSKHGMETFQGRWILY